MNASKLLGTAARFLLGGALAAHPFLASAESHWRDRHATETVRFATFNASLNRSAPGELIADLNSGDNAQIQAVAEIIQRTQPDVLLINEFDYDAAGEAARLFQQNYLSISQNGAAPAIYPYVYSAPSNTGVASGFDLNNDGVVGESGFELANDAFGFGVFEGQYGMLLLSKYPIQEQRARTFQHFLWRDMPNALLPDNPDTDAPADWFSPEELEVVRLSSKSHWDAPINIRGRRIHALVSHPTPPVFDGPEDRNGTRNHDEIRFWADYISGRRISRYIVDDEGRRGGLSDRESFVIMGDENADPFDGDATQNPMAQLLEHPRVNVKHTPLSAGSADAAFRQGEANALQIGNRAQDTGDFTDANPGNLRTDYVLPSTDLTIVNSGVFWPSTDDELYRLVGEGGAVSSDHRLVWVDIRLR
ncbi:endonuclease/exonuclease/phosphatase family protein [Hahella sp. HN01]|uniref:endonuclease/exonuclease/phosphatase family protein n=1 Tax=Hahella sp. HN01 TaxID=2847262 RepID=UPI001C1EE3CB|nr:endonuclease/exonuclease/phosphatase family protein [Hahella sp. HN01]MBU6950311.1 endonuclease/exonuclease/phosphatase family protein [Hahella sp. HN01]